MIPARRTYGLLLLGIAIAPLIALLWPGSEPITASVVSLLLLDGTILALAWWDSWQVRPHRVQVTRQPLHRLSIRRDNLIELQIQAGAMPAQIQVRDRPPLDISVSASLLELELPAHGSDSLTYTARPTRRGEFTWGQIQVRQLGRWRLAWHGWTLPQTQQVAIYPDLVGLRALSLRLTLQSAGNLRQARRLGMGTEFAELRDYSPGDDIRLIDWKATARRDRPLIRVLEPEQEQTLIVLLDRGRLMTANVQGIKRFDWGLNTTLALALAALNRGDRVGVGVFDRDIHTWIPPARGAKQLPLLIERLAPIQPVLLEPDYFAASTALVRQQARRALVVLITDLIDVTASTELLACLGRLAPRYLPFCITLRDPEIDRQAHATATDLDTAYTRAVALDLLAQRQVAFSQLKQQGVLVLDAPADQISDQAVDRYLLLKAKNQL